MIHVNLIKDQKTHSEIKQWCHDNIGDDMWYSETYGTWSWVFLNETNKQQEVKYEFLNSDDAVLFKLRWA